MGYEPVTIREAAQMEVLLFVGLAFVGGLAVIFWGFQTYQFGRIIRDTPPEPVRSVAMGRTEVVGNVEPHKRMYDQPFTDGQCVYGKLKVREYKEYPNDDDKDDQWETVQTEEFATSFMIDDDTGQILIDPNDDTMFEVSSAHTTNISVDGGQSPPPPVQEFLSSAKSGAGSPPGVMATTGDDGASGLKGRVSGVLGSVTGGRIGSSDSGDEMDDAGTGGGQAGSAGGPNTDGPTNGPQGHGQGDQSPAGQQSQTEDLDEFEKVTEQVSEDASSVEHVTRSQLGSVSSTSRDRKYEQEVIPAEEEIYVYGGATRRDPTKIGPDDEAVAIQTDPSTEEFIISDKSEFELAKTYRNRSVVYMLSGLIASAFILALLAQILITGPLYGIDRAMPGIIGFLL